MTTATMKTAIASAVLGAGLLAGCAPIRLQPWDSTPKKAAKVTANVAIWSVVGPVLAAGAVLYAVGGDSNQAAQSLSQMSTPLAATYHRVKRKRGHNVAVTALARKLVVLVWYLLRKQEPYRYGPVAHTCRKLRRLTPGLARAKPGHVPHTLDAVYREHGLPLPAAPTAAEKRAAARNLRVVTRQETRMHRLTHRMTRMLCGVADLRGGLAQSIGTGRG